MEPYISELAEDVVNQLLARGGKTEAQQQADLGAAYNNVLLEVVGAIIDVESGKDSLPKTPAQRMGQQIFDVARRKGGSIRVDWLGNLNYAITRLIQMVPHSMAQKHGWKSEFNQRIYLMTAGAIEHTALAVRERYVPGNIEWVLDGLVGVLFDIADEYKRRVNIAYQAVQMKERGDVYYVPFRTEIVEVKNQFGKGYQEIMKSY
jgi:hypothetical protein